MDREPIPGLEKNRYNLARIVRKELAEFEEKHPSTLGEFFGDFELNFPGGAYRNLPSATSEHKSFLEVVDLALKKTELGRQGFVNRHLGQEAAQKPVTEILQDLREQGRIKISEGFRLTDEKQLGKIGREVAGIRKKINGLLLPPYFELRLQGFDHVTITQ